jgi:hypothetical protein
MAKQYTTEKLPPIKLICIDEGQDDSVSSYLPFIKKEQDALVQMRAKLWDAYRLAYIILGEGSIRGGFNLENGSLLRAIRAVSESKEELSHLNKCLDLCYQREKRHRQNFESKEVLRDKCQALENQMTEQRLEYQALHATHQEYVQDTKEQLQDLYLLHDRNRGQGSVVHTSTFVESRQKEEEEDPQESQAYQQLFVRVAKASAQPQVYILQTQLKASREETRRVQQQCISQKEEMEYVTHVERLATALKRAACQQQGTRCSNIIAGSVTCEEFKEILSKLQSRSPSASSFQERQDIHVTILKMLIRLAANNPTRETVHDLEVKLAAAIKNAEDRAALIKDLLAEIKVIEWEKQHGQEELQTTEAWYQEKLFTSMKQEKEQQAEIQALGAQLDELAVVAVQVEGLKSELETSRQQYQTELEQTRMREQTSSKKVVELEAQLKQVMEDQQLSLILLESARTPAADKNADESTEATTTTPPSQKMEEEWKFSPPCLSPADTDSASAHDFSSSGYSNSGDDFFKTNFIFNDKRDAVVFKKDAPPLWVPQPRLQQALNKDKELRETQEQLLRSQHRIAELEKCVGRQQGGDASTATQLTGQSAWFSLDPASSDRR